MSGSVLAPTTANARMQERVEGRIGAARWLKATVSELADAFGFMPTAIHDSTLGQLGAAI